MNENTLNQTQDLEKTLQKILEPLIKRLEILEQQQQNTNDHPEKSTNDRPIKITTTATNNQRSPKKTPRARTREFMPEGLYLPELDYLVYITRQRGEFFTTRYQTNKPDTLDMKNGGRAVKKGLVAYYGVEAHGGSVNYVDTVRHSIIIPSTTLAEDIVNKYGMDYVQDFRESGAKTRYMPAVMNRNHGNSATRSAQNANQCTREFNWLVGGGTGLGGTGLLGGGSIDAGLLGGVSTASFLQVINNTREHWLKYQTPYAKSLRIIDEADMMTLLDALEAWGRGEENEWGQENAKPIGQPIGWQVVIDSAGNKVDELKADGSHVLPDADPVNYWEKTNFIPLSPLKVRPLW
jgi:hypothetical protein